MHVTNFERRQHPHPPVARAAGAARAWRRARSRRRLHGGCGGRCRWGAGGRCSRCRCRNCGGRCTGSGWRRDTGRRRWRVGRGEDLVLCRLGAAGGPAQGQAEAERRRCKNGPYCRGGVTSSHQKAKYTEPAKPLQRFHPPAALLNPKCGPIARPLSYILTTIRGLQRCAWLAVRDLSGVGEKI